jgi:apolipoprotein N-acyltransferase
MHDYGQMWAWLAALATLALAALLALFPAAAIGAAHRWVAPGARLWLGVPAAWALAEWLRGVVLSGLPWLATGYAHTDGPLAGYAPLVGVDGVGLIAAWVAGAAAMTLAGQPRPARRAVVLALAVAASLLAAGQLLRGIDWSRPAGTPIAVRLAQGNIPQDEKFAEDGMQRATDVYGALMDQDPQRHLDLVVLPEAAVPLPVGDLPETLQQALRDYPRRRGAALVFGVFIVEPGERYFNSAIGLAPDERQPQRYSKRHLVPFGEFIPFGFRWFVDLMNIPIGDQRSGPAYQPPMQLAGQRLAVNICFEDLFGEEIIAAWRDPALEPTLLLNLSNLAWFDDSIALPQHLQISRMRALETGRPLLRATNTGATAIIDARGRVVAQLPYSKSVSLHGQVFGFSGRTPYIRFGDTPALVLALALLAAAAAAVLRPTAPARTT